MRALNAILTALLVLMALPAFAQEGQPAGQPSAGQVQIPLDVYNQLMEQASDPRAAPRDVPARWALGEAKLTAAALETQGHVSAEVRVELNLEVLDAQWVLIPLLPAGTAVRTASEGGNAIQLVATPLGLSWGVKGAGKRSVSLTYQVDAHRSSGGYSLALPTPQATAMTLEASLPGVGLDAAVIPSAGSSATPSGDRTLVRATLPTTSGVQLSWRAPGQEGHSFSRAVYTGTLSDDAAVFNASFDVTLFSQEPLTLALLPEASVLQDVQVDGKASAITTEAGWFATVIQGRGGHTVSVRFQVPVTRDDGPPRLALSIPRVPVSRFEVTLPGKKELIVEPATHVTSSERGSSTVASFHVPMTDRVSISWAEAIPEDIKTEVRANASLYHLAHAEEGVLYVRAMAAWEVTRGETATLDLDVPQDAQINRITSEAGGVGDWRVTEGRGDSPNRVTVFLDHKISGEYRFDVYYELLLGTGEQRETPVSVPLIRAAGVGRQRGMVSLLASKELAVKPDVEEGLNRVGENQLPAWVRQAVDLTIAHTFKYADDTVVLKAHAAPPERQQGRFDAQVDTLVSIGDVTMRGATTIEVNVKSGATMSIELGAPADVNVLNLAAPSLRTWKVNTEAGQQTVDVQFTQDMEGQFRIEVTYERIMSDGIEEVPVPTLSVTGAEVEQGRIAVEALTAVEVQTARVQGLSTLDTSELPKQLILKTTNPILLAYKYVQSDTPSQLSLKVTRHSEIAVQDAIIDHAAYRTLYTPDGQAITSARFQVRNSRKQFLKVQLPRGSEVWKAWVDGSEEKPALAQGEDGGEPHVLIKILNSTQGFAVDLIYTTPVTRMGRLGTLSGELPRPDMIATRSTWDVYVPDNLSYGEPESNMRLIEGRANVTAQRMAEELKASNESLGKPLPDAMRFMVPTAGVRFSFEKLYANQSTDNAVFSLPYATVEGAMLAEVLSVAGAALAWLGLASLLLPLWSRAVGVLTLVVGLALAGVALHTFQVDSDGALYLSVAAVLVLAAAAWRRRSSGRGPGGGAPLTQKAPPAPAAAPAPQATRAQPAPTSHTPTSSPLDDTSFGGDPPTVEVRIPEAEQHLGSEDVGPRSGGPSSSEADDGWFAHDDADEDTDLDAEPDDPTLVVDPDALSSADSPRPQAETIPTTGADPAAHTPTVLTERPRDPTTSNSGGEEPKR